MDDDEIDAVLVASLGQVGGRVSRGAGAGARFTAKRLRTETATGQLEVAPTRSERVLAHLSEVLRAPSQIGDDGCCRLRAVIGSGVGGLNPAFVLVEIELLTGRVSVAAYAKEGLIQQRTAQKAVDRVLAAAQA